MCGKETALLINISQFPLAPGRSLMKLMSQENSAPDNKLVYSFLLNIRVFVMQILGQKQEKSQLTES